jgi:predicted transglutaminase-like cysteine proteinase
MREPHLGRSKARPYLYGRLHLAILGFALVLAGGSTAQTVAELPSGSGSITTRNHPTSPVPGWLRLCQQRPDECVVNPAEPATITLTSQAWETLIKVNRQVNATISSVTDMEHWGVEDHWSLAEDGRGDCEDFQLVKRRRLVAAGFPRRVLRMTAVIDGDGEPHAVLMVRTSRGDFILDNKRDAVLPWRQTGYIYLQREGSTGSTWVSLGGAYAPPVATTSAPARRNGRHASASPRQLPGSP